MFIAATRQQLLSQLLGDPADEVPDHGRFLNFRKRPGAVRKSRRLQAHLLKHRQVEIR